MNYLFVSSTIFNENESKLGKFSLKKKKNHQFLVLVYNCYDYSENSIKIGYNGHKSFRDVKIMQIMQDDEEFWDDA